MKPLIVLLFTFAAAFFTIKLITGNYEVALPARIAMSTMMVFTAVGHFVFTKGMTMMLPRFIPFKKEIVYSTGIMEIIAAAGLLIPALQAGTGWSLILFLIVLLPANIYAAIRHIDYQKGTPTGTGPDYLWFRVPLQIFFIVWVYFAAVKF